MQTVRALAADIRPAAVAGAFYPADPAELRRVVTACLDSAPSHAVAPKAVVSPHAGFVYSGPIAGTAFKPLAGMAAKIRRIVMLGPPHRMPVKAFCVPAARAFRTPLGDVPLDPEFMRVVRAHPGVEVDDAPHRQEHGIEVQLPFLQQVLGNFTLVPILVGGVAPAEVDALLAKLWGGDETLVVISSDLSHYHDYATAKRLDEEARRSLEVLRPDQLREEQACGRHALRGLLARAGALDLRATTLDLRSSGDTAGHNQRDRVVGYGAWAFEYAATARLPDAERQRLADIARKAIGLGIEHGKPAQVKSESFPRPLQALRATFVTLTLDGRLRGCIGSVVPHQPLVADVVANAHKAAFHDPRFKPLTLEESRRLGVSVSILSHPRPMAFRSEAEAIDGLRPEIDGIILEARDAQGQPRRGIFLPQVWEQLPDPKTFFRHLKAKAGLPGNFWNDGVKLWRYRTETFH